MTDFLTGTKDVLTDLEQGIEEQAHAFRDIYKDQALSVLDECIQKRKARSWLHGATDIDESTILEEWLHVNPPLSKLANRKAKNVVKAWRVKRDKEDAYYGSFVGIDFQKPVKDESVFEYCTRVAKLVEAEGPGARLEWRAFKSFLRYLRIHFPAPERAFLEHIFPEKMDIFSERIIRKVAPEVYAIPEDSAAAILIELGRIARYDRQNAQLSALESLGLCWLCLAASRLRLPVQLEAIHKMEIQVVQIGSAEQQPVLMLPTLFGEAAVKISHRMAKFLIVLSQQQSKTQNNYILKSPLRSLSRCLKRAIKNLGLDSKFGNITFITLISPPHPFSSSRYQRK